MNTDKIKKAIIGGLGGLAAVLHLDFLVNLVGALGHNAGSLFTAFSISAFTLGDVLPSWIPVGAVEVGALFFGALFVSMKLANVASNIKDSIDD